jgi:ADP-heptose:LPS heptosyltransferase
MFEETRKKIGIYFARIFVNRHKMQEMNFSRIFSKANSALVIIPENLEERKIAIPFLSHMQTKFAGNKLTIVINESIKDVPSTIARSKVIILEKDQRNFFFLPGGFEIKELFLRRYDCVVDLNYQLEPAAAYICKSINSPLKVGFVKEHSDSFYNFQINAQKNNNIRLRYEQLFRTLKMF